MSGLYSQLSPNDGRVSVVYGRVSALYNQLSGLCCWVSVVYGQVRGLYGRVNVFMVG